MLATIDRLHQGSPEEGVESVPLGVAGKVAFGFEPALGDALMLQNGHKPEALVSANAQQVQLREIASAAGEPQPGVTPTAPEGVLEAQHPVTRDLGSFVLNR